MKREVTLAADLLLKLKNDQKSSLKLNQLISFKESLIQVLEKRFSGHWYPQKPTRGSAFRCIRINTKMDPVVVEAGSIAGIEINDLRTIYPTELTIWIDPSHVSYRIGENGSTCVLFDGVSEKSDYVDNSKPKNIQVVKNEKVSTANECDSSLRSSPKIDLEKLNTSQERHDNTSPTKLNASSPPFHPSPRANSTTKKAEYIARPVPTVSSRPYFFTYVNGEMVHFTPSVRISSQPSTPQYGCGAMDILSSDINNINIHCNNNTYVSS
ncbi:hypothetical protein TKK_0008988 [Trichogramma kaykai]